MYSVNTVGQSSFQKPDRKKKPAPQPQRPPSNSTQRSPKCPPVQGSTCPPHCHSSGSREVDPQNVVGTPRVAGEHDPKEDNNYTGDGTESTSSSSCEGRKSRRSRRNSYKDKSYLQRLFLLLKRLYGSQDEEDEMDDYSIQLTRYRPEELAKLTRTTQFSKREIQLMYRGFKQECPTGLVDEESFKNIFGQFFPQGDASSYAHYVFNTIKHNSEGQISFEDFLKALSTVSRGTTEEKLQWIFGLYDTNHDGMITKAEMLDVVHAIYAMMGLGHHKNAAEQSNAATEHVEKIFHLIDSNKDGAITIEELADWVSSDETIIQSLSMMDTVLYTMKESKPPSPPARQSLSSP